MSNKPLTSKEAAAEWIGTSYEDLQDYRYHHGMTKIPLYVVGNTYLYVTANGKKPSKSDQEYITNGEGSFQEATDRQAEYLKTRGRTVWVYESK